MKVSLKNFNTLKLESQADEVFLPNSEEDFAQILAKNPNTKVLGAGSNVILSSLGLKKIIFTNSLKNFTFQGHKLYAQAGVKLPLLAQKASQEGLSGLEFAIGIPATVGGAVFMNAGAHKQDVASIFDYAKVFDGQNILTLKNINLSYRHSALMDSPLTLIGAGFNLAPSTKEATQRLIEENLNFRKTRQPSLKLPNCGSVFKNPPNQSAGKLLEIAMAKTLKFGPVEVFEGHANFIINTGGANSTHISQLMFMMYTKVKENFGIKLVPEVEFIGQKTAEEEEIWNIMLNQK